jgi:hypothetical protein
MQNVDGDLQMLWLWEGIIEAGWLLMQVCFFWIWGQFGMKSQVKMTTFLAQFTWLVGVVMRQLYMCLALEKMHKKVSLLCM